MNFLGDPKLRKKSGRYYGCWYDSRIQNEHWVSLKTKKKRVARRRLTELEDKVDDGRFDPSEDRYTGSLTLAEAANRWRDDQSEVRDGTTRNRHYVLSSFRDHIGEQVYLRQLMPEDCESWIYDPQKSGWTKCDYYARLDAFFRWCREAGHLKRNPLEDVARPREPSTNKPQWLSREEVDQIEIAVQHDYEERIQKYKEGAVIWLCDVIELAVYTGLRRAELIHQRWKDTDPEEGFFRVRPYEHENGQFTTKNDEERMVPVVDAIRPVLERLREAQMEKGSYAPDSTVIKGPTGRKLGPRQVSRNFRKYRQMALPHREEISFHNLRHTAASWMVQNGMDLYYVKEVLGHASIETTQKYAHLAPDGVQSAMEEALSRI